MEYRQNTNLKQREQYHLRKTKKKKTAKKIAKSIENDISFGDSQNI
jgi:hypothetical protein